MISTIIRSLIRTNSNQNHNWADEKRWKQHGIGASTDSAIAGFIRLMVRGVTTVESQEEAIDPRFKEHYVRFIQPETERFEDARLEALGKFRLRCFIAIPVLLGALVWFLLNHGSPFTMLLSFLAFAILGWAAWPVMFYKANIRQTIFPKLFPFFGDKWVYRPGNASTKNRAAFDLVMQIINALLAGSNHKGVSVSLMNQRAAISHTSNFSAQLKEYEPFGIVPGHDSANLTDFLTGDYKTVTIQLVQCELSTRGRTQERTRKELESVFLGLLIMLDVPKRFSGHTVVKRDKGAVGNWFGKQFSSTLAPVKLEDPRFEARYEVYGTDQVEARYLLTNSFMERLVALEDLFAESNGGRCAIQCAFRDGKLLFAIPTAQEWFSTGSIFKPANFIDEINQILKEMDQLFAIIDVLKLDDRSGL